jgi:hypothetical protein
VQERRHALPLCEAFFELEHLVFEYADFFRNKYEFCVASKRDTLDNNIEVEEDPLLLEDIALQVG